ncbi:MAG: putative addiction module antidote protein [Caulobacteraceae bacterium]|nr:putative addiction module antidote protein [Caulobacteraceae bacterium]
MTLETRPFDAAEYLDTAEAVQEYLIAAFETDDPAFIADALGVVGRAKGMAALAQEVGVARTSLYRTLSSEGRPEFLTVLKVLKALGLKLVPTPVDSAA